MKLICLLFVILQGIIAVDFCSNELKCNKNLNTACKCHFDSKCREPRIYGANDKIQQAIVDAHNKYRDKIASGNETRGGNSKVTEMFELKWDEDLEYVAKCWNKRCKFAHDTCRRTEDFDDVGQNIYWSSGKACEWSFHLKAAIDGWYNEIAHMTPICIQKYGIGCDTTKIARFSQLVWAKTTHVGCSLIEYDKQCQITCNYGPSGNFMGEPVYVNGEPNCTYKSVKYDNLCWVTYDDDDDEPEFRAGKVRSKANTFNIVIFPYVFLYEFLYIYIF